MKYLLIIISLFSIPLLNGQNFVDTRNSWTVAESENGLPPLIKKYFFVNDSIEIDGMFYRQLHSSSALGTKKRGEFYRQDGKKVW